MAKRPKKPSLKDKGVEAWFPQGAEPDEAVARAAAREEGAAPGSPDQPTHESLQASKQSSSDTEGGGSDVDLLVFEDAMARIAEAGRITASFRFTEPELEALNDIVYRGRKRHKVRLVKQEIVRLGLAVLLAEYKERGSESALGRYLRHLKEH